MNDVEISPKTGKQIKAAVWISFIFGLLLFYVFGYFPLLMLVVSQTSLLDSPPDCSTLSFSGLWHLWDG